MINLSEINLSSLPWLPLDARSAFPRNPAIYFAIDSQGTVQYIGRSLNPKSRWANHHKYEQLEAIGNIKIVYLFVDSASLLPGIESALILWFDPPLNVVGKSANSVKPQDLQAGQVFVDISGYWPTDEWGNPRSINSVYEGIKGTPNEVGRNTLRVAKDGELDRGYFSNLVKLARLCSKWSGKQIDPSDLLKIEDAE